MADIFQVEAARWNGRESFAAELELPLGPYGLLDALERLQAQDPEEVEAEVLEFHDFGFLHPILRGPQKLNQLNDLAWKLSGLDRRQSAALQGLIQMEKGPVTLPRLWSLSHNVDSCHVVDEAMNDSQLGRFYAENGFVPEVEGVPDSAFDLLDFERIGREARLREGGVFTENGYVVRHEGLRQVPFPVKGPPQRPEYIFRLTLGICGAEAQVLLELPASRSRLQDALDQLGDPRPESLVITGYDGAIPALPDRLGRLNDLYQLNELALAVQAVMERGQLTRYKAVLEAGGCEDLNQMTELADRMTEYHLSSACRTGADIALDDLKALLDQRDVEIITPYLDLDGYGRALAEEFNIAITSYGALKRYDGQPVQIQENNVPQMGGMGVTM